MDLNTIKKVIAIVEESGVAELEVEQDGFRVLVRKSVAPSPVTETQVHMVPSPAAPPLVAAASKAAAQGESEEDASLHKIKSPMVGTFYKSPAPDADPFVQVGDQVNPDTVVCIIEAMKVMNEIKAEVAGTVVDLLVDNAQPVEFGQPLIRVKPA